MQREAVTHIHDHNAWRHSAASYAVSMRVETILGGSGRVVTMLAPLTFDWHRLSPLAAFTSVHTFFTMEGSDSEFANFTLPTLKAFLEARSQNVSVNKQ